MSADAFVQLPPESVVPPDRSHAVLPIAIGLCQFRSFRLPLSSLFSGGMRSPLRLG